MHLLIATLAAFALTTAQPGPAWSTLKTYADELKLDAAKFEQDLASEAVSARVQRDMDSGTAANVAGTPGLFVDGRPAPVDVFSQPDVAQQLKTYGETRARRWPTSALSRSALPSPIL